MMLTRSHAVEALLVLLMIGATTAGWEGYQSTIFHSPATVHVRGYTRKDGEHIDSYYRRPSGVAAADQRKTDAKEWVRVMIFVGWVIVMAVCVAGMVVWWPKRVKGDQ